MAMAEQLKDGNLSEEQLEELECLQCIYGHVEEELQVVLLSPDELRKKMGEAGVMDEDVEDGIGDEKHSAVVLIVRITDSKERAPTEEAQTEEVKAGGEGADRASSARSRQSLEKLVSQGLPYFLSIYWPPNYPASQTPVFFIDPLHNTAKNSILHSRSALSSCILEFVRSRAESFLEESSGCASTLALVEMLKTEAYDALSLRESFEASNKSLFDEAGQGASGLLHQKKALHNTDSTASATDVQTKNSGSALEEMRHLSKAQKRNLWNKVSMTTGEKPRGWNWVDIISHLSKTPQTVVTPTIASQQQLATTNTASTASS